MRQDLEDLKLLDLLNSCSAEDKSPLVDYITDEGEGRISLDSEVKDQLVDAKKTKLFNGYADELIVDEVQQFGGHTWINAIRGTGVSYDEVVRDVASKIGAKYSDDSDCVLIPATN